MGGHFGSALTAIFTAFLLMSQDETSVSPFGFINSAVFGGLAFGIYRRSRIAAVSAFVLFAADTILTMYLARLFVIAPLLATPDWAAQAPPPS